MMNEQGELSDGVRRGLEKAGEIAVASAVNVAGKAMLGPMGGAVASVPANRIISAAPAEAKFVGGVGAALGVSSSLQTVAAIGVGAGGVALAPAAAFVAATAVVVGSIGFVGAWVFKKLSE